MDPLIPIVIGAVLDILAFAIVVRKGRARRKRRREERFRQRLGTQDLGLPTTFASSRHPAFKEIEDRARKDDTEQESRAPSPNRKPGGVA